MYCLWGERHGSAGDDDNLPRDILLAGWAIEKNLSLNPVPCVSRRGSHNSLSKKPSRAEGGLNNWVQGLDLNQRPSGYEPDELPGCSTLQRVKEHNEFCVFVMSTAFWKRADYGAFSGSPTK